MILTKEQQAILDGEKGETLAKVMKTLVLYGDAFGATKMVPVDSEKGHLVTSFGLKVMKPVYSLMDQLIEGGALSKQKFSVDDNNGVDTEGLEAVNPNLTKKGIRYIIFI